MPTAPRLTFAVLADCRFHILRGAMGGSWVPLNAIGPRAADGRAGEGLGRGPGTGMGIQVHEIESTLAGVACPMRKGVDLNAQARVVSSRPLGTSGASVGDMDAVASLTTVGKMMHSTPRSKARANSLMSLLVTGSVVVMTPMEAQADPTVPSSPCCSTNLMDDQVVADIPTDTGVSCNGICGAVGLPGSLWGMPCDAAANATEEDTLTGAKMVAVFDPPGGETFCHAVGNLSNPREYCAFGVDALGEEFYCSWDHDDGPSSGHSEVTLAGATEGDVLQFWWNTTNVEYNLDAWTTATFIGRQLGYQGNDEIIGSRAYNPTTTYYYDLLNGGTGEDRGCGLAGPDSLNGEGDADVMCGDDHLDTLTGGGESDTLCGLAGDGDQNDGGPANDWLSHGNNGDLDYNNGGPDSGTGTQDTCDDAGDDGCENDFGASDPCDSL